ncbi:hypothetical protein WMF20_01775 [Sorangium sp. So ce834]|uniref:hypothetical protein n=1 Tax=Sorangium sp. So ce834 TaxID=3133321 RepID=UPI003F6028D6
MKLSKVLSGLAGCVLSTASLTGCIIVDGDDDGSLTVSMTIDGSDAAWECFDHDVSGLAVSVEDEAGFLVAEEVTDCEDFGLTIGGLSEGYYDVEVWLVDFDGHTISDIVRVEGVDVLDGHDTLVDVDFPWTWIDP